ncbi:MAG: hypothetical protein BAA01_01955 [Bacillus thermozeamaize]|uniref:FAD:protein FMN transferase n=1 Tax=Bacillus thermozeamaize TaxID=230954 RepID=A0A1Y3PIZ1_9BACI|nr:MAG: hypothetical protein BAA01_01955 [Bacillus thermozeamaize]
MANMTKTELTCSHPNASAKKKQNTPVPMATHRFRAMNTEIEVILPAEHSHHARTAEIWFRNSQERFSRFDPKSELSRINQSSSSWVFVSKAMAEVLSLTRHFWLKTDGLFSPFLLDALEKAGYAHSFECLPPVAISEPSAISAEETCPKTRPLPQPAVTGPDRHTFHIYPSQQLLERPPGLRIDLGGIVKGWTAQQLARHLQREHAVPWGLVNAGGDLYAWGGYGCDAPWTIGISHPLRDRWEPLRPDMPPAKDIAFIQIRRGAVATSGTMARRWRTPEGIQHHLIDPRTGRPSQSDLVQCTVISPCLVEAEVLAKVIVILGQKEGVRFLKRYMETEKRPLAAFLISDKGEGTLVLENGEVQRMEVKR